MKKGFLILLAIGIVFCSACKSEEREEQELIDDFLGQTDYVFEETEDGIYYQIIKEGDGNNPTSSDNVKVHYQGELLDGTIFDSSYGGSPRNFSLDGNVIEGWSKAVPLIERGGTGVFLIPSDFAYGQFGSPPNIPGNAPLLFTIELIDFL